MNEDQLRELLMQNPAAGLEAAISQYGTSVRWIVKKIVGTNKQQDIEECVSDTFVRLWQGIGQFDADKGTSLKSYLFGIARHTALDYRRKSLRLGELVPMEEAELSVSVDFEENMARSINSRLLQETIRELPPPDKEIFVSRYFMGERVTDIAQRLGLSQKAVENKLYRGKKGLKNALMERGIIL